MNRWRDTVDIADEVECARVWLTWRLQERLGPRCVPGSVAVRIIRDAILEALPPRSYDAIVETHEDGRVSLSCSIVTFQPMTIEVKQ